MPNNLTIEQGLRRAEDQAAMLRLLADAAAGTTDSVPESVVFSGIADACREIEGTGQGRPKVPRHLGALWRPEAPRIARESAPQRVILVREDK